MSLTHTHTLGHKYTHSVLSLTCTIHTHCPLFPTSVNCAAEKERAVSTDGPYRTTVSTKVVYLERFASPVRFCSTWRCVLTSHQLACFYGLDHCTHACAPSSGLSGKLRCNTSLVYTRCTLWRRQQHPHSVSIALPVASLTCGPRAAPARRPPPRT
jgi:hypothetical protein